MSSRFEEGQRVRLKPREGAVELVREIQIYPKERGQPPMHSYLVRWDDGSADTFSEKELEKVED